MIEYYTNHSAMVNLDYKTLSILGLQQMHTLLSSKNQVMGSEFGSTEHFISAMMLLYYERCAKRHNTIAVKRFYLLPRLKYNNDDINMTANFYH